MSRQLFAEPCQLAWVPSIPCSGCTSPRTLPIHFCSHPDVREVRMLVQKHLLFRLPVSWSSHHPDSAESFIQLHQ